MSGPVRLEPEMPEIPGVSGGPEGGSQGPEESAEFLERFLAFALDALPFFIVDIVVQLFLFRSGTVSLPPWQIHGAFALGFVLYNAVMTSGGGATFGKLLVGIRIVTLEDEPVGFGRAFLRAVCYAASFPLFHVGFLWALLPGHRAWHDRLSGTRVISVSERSEAAQWLVRIAAVAVFGLGGALWFQQNLFLPNSEDRRRVAAARSVLRRVAAAQEAYRASYGGYTARVEDLAAATGDPARFRDILLEVVEPEGFEIYLIEGRYIIRAIARNRQRTEVVVKGPLQRR